MKISSISILLISGLIAGCGSARIALAPDKARVDVTHDELREFRIAQSRTGLGQLSAINYISRRFLNARLHPINGGSFEKQAVALRPSVHSFSFALDGDSTLLLQGIDYFVDPNSGSGRLTSSLLSRDPGSGAGFYLRKEEVSPTCSPAQPTLVVTNDLAPVSFAREQACKFPILRITSEALHRASGIAGSVSSLLDGDLGTLTLPVEIGVAVEAETTTSGRWTVVGALAGAHHSKKSKAVVVFTHLNDYNLIGGVQHGVLPPSDAAVATLLELADVYSLRQSQSQSLPYSMIFAVVQTDGIERVDLTRLEQLALWSKDDIAAAIHLSSGSKGVSSELVRVEANKSTQLIPVLIPESRTRRRMSDSSIAPDFDIWLTSKPESGLADFVDRVVARIDRIQDEL